MKQYDVLDYKFPETKEELQQHIKNIFEDPDTLHKVNSSDKNIYYHEKSNSVVLFNPNARGKRGVVFQPLHGIEYYKMVL